MLVQIFKVSSAIDISDSKPLTPDTVLKILQSNKFIVVDVRDIVPEKEIIGDSFINTLSNEVLQKQDYASLCHVQYKATISETRFPRKITYAALAKKTDFYHCRPIFRTVTYFDRNVTFHKHLQQSLYLVKTVKVVVGFEAMKRKSSLMS